MSEAKPAAADVEEKPSRLPANKALLGIVGANLLLSTAMTAYIVTRPAPAAAVAHGDHKEAKEGEHGAAGEKKAEEGHGEKKAEGEGHGEKKADGEGHGEKKAEGEGQGEKKAEGEGQGDKKEPTSDATTGSTARLEDIIVHLRNPEVDRYARITLDVEMSTPSELTQLQPRTPQIRDAVITALSEETFESLRGAEGLANMKAKVRDRIDDVVPGTVRAVYVSGFIVQ